MAIKFAHLRFSAQYNTLSGSNVKNFALEDNQVPVKLETIRDFQRSTDILFNQPFEGYVLPDNKRLRSFGFCPHCRIVTEYIDTDPDPERGPRVMCKLCELSFYTNGVIAEEYPQFHYLTDGEIPPPYEKSVEKLHGWPQQRIFLIKALDNFCKRQDLSLEDKREAFRLGCDIQEMCCGG